MLSPRSMSRFFNLRVPLRNRYERSRVWADIVSVGTDQPIVCALFYDMRRPTRNTRNHKERREHRSGDAAKVISCSAVEIEIGEQLFLAPHHLLNSFGNGEEPLVARSPGQFLRPGFNHVRAWIGNFVNPVAETHDQFFCCNKVEYSLFGFIRALESFDQLHGRFIRAAMQWTTQRADSACHGRIEVRQR